MNNTHSPQFIKIFVFLGLVLACISCAPDRVIIVVTATLDPTATAPPEPPPSPPAPPTPIPLLDFTWDIIPKCIGGKLKEATIELRISGGMAPYDISPDSSFPAQAGEPVRVIVKSADGQSLTKIVKILDTCKVREPSQVIPTSQVIPNGTEPPIDPPVQPTRTPKPTKTQRPGDDDDENGED